MNNDAKLGRRVPDEPADVRFGAEPQLTAVGKAGGQRLGDEQACSAEAGGHDRCLVKERPRVENLEDIRIGMTYRIAAGGAEERQDLAELASPAAVERLEQSPVAACRQRQLVIWQPGRPIATEGTYSQVLIDDEHSSARRLSRQRCRPRGAGRTR